MFRCVVVITALLCSLARPLSFVTACGRVVARMSLACCATSLTCVCGAAAALQTITATRNVRMKDFFTDYDRLRSGHIPCAKFRTAIAASKIELTTEELSALENAYRNVKVASAAVARRCSTASTCVCSSSLFLRIFTPRDFIWLAVRRVQDSSHVNWRELSYEVDGGDEKLERMPTSTLTQKSGRRVADLPSAVEVPSEDIDPILRCGYAAFPAPLRPCVVTTVTLLSSRFSLLSLSLSHTLALCRLFLSQPLCRRGLPVHAVCLSD